MTRDQFPWPNLTDDEIRVMVANGFNPHELATVAGASDDVGRWMHSRAIQIPVALPA